MIPNQTNIAQLPSTSLKVIRKLPKTAGVYLVISEDEQVLYVGRSKNIQRRWRGHHRLAEFQQMSNVRIAWIEISDISVLPLIEEALIQYFKPIYHRALLFKDDDSSFKIDFDQPLPEYVRNSILLLECYF